MSDSDDTDLLLLIPPDFFLVRSPDLDDFDSDCDVPFGLDDNGLNSSLVSDLISQVNDLESRICLIENVDRSHTHCSTCFEDSFVDLSVNSLTESDAQRFHGKNTVHTDFTNSLPKTDHNVKQSEVNSKNTNFLLEKHLADLHVGAHSLMSNNSIDDWDSNSFKKTEFRDLDRPSHNKIKVTDIRDHMSEPSEIKEDQTQLLSEVDAYLEANNDRLKHTSLNDVEQQGLESELQLNNEQVILELNSDNSVISVNRSIQNDNVTQIQSIALPDVLNLLKEMEDTQFEMEKKLKLHESQTRFSTGKGTPKISLGEECSNKNAEYFTRINNIKALELGDLHGKSPISTFNKPTENFLDRYKPLQESVYQNRNSYKPIDRNTHLRTFISTTASGSNEEMVPNEKDSRLKSLSPNRTTVTHNPIDIVKANLPRRESRTNISQLVDQDGSPRKPSFKRHLNFGRHALSPRAIKTKASLNFREEENNHAGSQQNSDRMHTNLTQHSGNKSSLEDKFNFLSLHRQQGMSDAPTKNIFCGMENQPPSSNENLQQKISSNNLLSLSELWNKEPTFHSDDPIKLRQKLEEEKYRRQHCEQQIQVLQLRVLEEQERLAVAVRVDQEKDKAILQITESWRRLNDHWAELEQQRHHLAEQLHQEREFFKTKNEEMVKKIEMCEKEVSQALDLAAGYKEKSEKLQHEMEILRKENSEKDIESNSRLKLLTKENEKINVERSKLLQHVEECQKQLDEEEELLSKLKSELERSKKELSDLDAETTVLKEVKESLTIKIKDERNRNTVLEQQNKALQQTLNEAAKREKAAQEEAKVSCERIDIARTELRALYQGQLESVVQEKLKEFQSQLVAAESAMKTELHLKEKEWAEKAKIQCRLLQEKNRVDLQRLTDSHHEEINRWKDRLADCERMRSISEGRLKEETSQRAGMAQKLHNVLETQWREALSVISNPVQNIYDCSSNENRSRWPSSQPSSERLKGGADLKVARSDSNVSLVNAEDIPFSKEGIVTCRTSQPAQDLDIRKYIEMLLEKGPANLHDTTQESLDSTHESHIPGMKWGLENQKYPGGQSERPGQGSKPPWK